MVRAYLQQPSVMSDPLKAVGEKAREMGYVADLYEHLAPGQMRSSDVVVVCFDCLYSSFTVKVPPGGSKTIPFDSHLVELLQKAARQSPSIILPGGASTQRDVPTALTLKMEGSQAVVEFLPDAESFDAASLWCLGYAEALQLPTIVLSSMSLHPQLLGDNTLYATEAGFCVEALRKLYSPLHSGKVEEIAEAVVGLRVARCEGW